MLRGEPRCFLRLELWTWSPLPRNILRSDALAQLQAERVLDAVTQRLLVDKEIAEASRLRRAAFTSFARAYEEVRRALKFLRHEEDDADAIVPSLYSVSVGRRRKQKIGARAKGEVAIEEPATDPMTKAAVRDLPSPTPENGEASVPSQGMLPDRSLSRYIDGLLAELASEDVAAGEEHVRRELARMPVPLGAGRDAAAHRRELQRIVAVLSALTISVVSRTEERAHSSPRS